VATRLLPDVPPTGGIFVIDTADLFSGLEGHSGTRRGLDRMCRLLKMQNLEHMHNAGNDAHVSPFRPHFFFEGEVVYFTYDWP
jgi:DNA polymerase III subunit epsilon-like, C-terminal domain